MERELNLKKDLDRIAKIRKWKVRFNKLRSRSLSPMSLSAFCRKYGFHKSHISRTQHGRSIPKDKFFYAVEKALSSEGV